MTEEDERANKVPILSAKLKLPKPPKQIVMVDCFSIIVQKGLHV